mmetsp:Transcript_14897/g.42987  ORF Transcript_14897/g.42987 Transcript_14897/m.42987 type:complete len:797 (-) Transcript_14897:76-2466(-)
MASSPKYQVLAGADSRTPLRSEGHSIMSAAAAAMNASIREFKWNKRDCKGTQFHEYTLSGPVGIVEAMLQKDPELVSQKFTWTTEYRGEHQENTGEPIHLAASKGRVDVVSVLLQARADVNAHVTRGEHPNYNVLNAAVWAEGKGGSLEMVQWLLDRKATIENNRDGVSPLHMAFQIGATDLLHPIRKVAKEQKVFTAIWNNPKGSPLESGIKSGSMSESELAYAAAATPISLRTFIDKEPRCVRPFLRRLKGSVLPSQLAAKVRGEELARVIRDHPDAALALFDFMTALPTCTEPGLNPLPARVSFGPRTRLERIRDLVNPTPDLLAFYERDTTWGFDGARFEGAAWQKHIDSRKWGKPYRDAEIRVCHVPNIVCVELFAALMTSSGRHHADQTSLRPFKAPVIRGAIEFVWWNGAVRYDLIQVSLCLWGLLVLIYDSVTGDFGGTKLSVDFLSAKGTVDTLMVLVQAIGWWGTAAPKCELFIRSNVWLFARGLVPIALRWSDGHGSILKVMVIFIYWLQIFTLFTVSEHASRSILPITRLVVGLVPAGLMTSVWFCAFLHAFQVVRHGGESSFRTNLLETFTTLLTGDMSTDENMSALQLMIAYFAVAIFTVYLLNIFISVIEKQHETQKEMSKETFQLMRADKCLNFLARSRVIPCRLLAKEVASWITYVAAAVALMMQVVSLAKGSTAEWMFPALTAVLLIMAVCSFQDKNAVWAKRSPDQTSGQGSLYLWLVLSRSSDGARDEEAEDVESFSADDDNAVGDRLVTGASDCSERWWSGNGGRPAAGSSGSMV